MTKLTPKALADFEALKARYPTATLREFSNGTALVTMETDIPAGWSASRITLRFIMPNGYPVAPPDGFWVEPALTVNGQPPHAAANGEMPEAGMTHQRFSWHFDGGHWSANRDNLLMWVSSCHERLEKLR